VKLDEKAFKKVEVDELFLTSGKKLIRLTYFFLLP